MILIGLITTSTSFLKLKLINQPTREIKFSSVLDLFLLVGCLEDFQGDLFEDFSISNIQILSVNYFKDTFGVL